MPVNAPNKTASGPIVLTSSTEEAAVEKVELFSIDGTPYFIDAVVPANVMLKFLHKLRTDEVDATSWLLETLLGDDGYAALMDWDGLTMDIFRQIVQAASAHMVDSSDQA